MDRVIITFITILYSGRNAPYFFVIVGMHDVYSRKDLDINRTPFNNQRIWIGLESLDQE